MRTLRTLLLLLLPVALLSQSTVRGVFIQEFDRYDNLPASGVSGRGHVKGDTLWEYDGSWMNASTKYLATGSVATWGNSIRFTQFHPYYFKIANGLIYIDTTVIARQADVGGGPSYWTDLRRTGADTANSSNTTLTTIGGLEFNASAATRYEFEFHVLFSSAATTTGIVLAVHSSSAPTLISYTAAIPIAADGAAAMFHGWGTASDDAVVGTAVQATNTVYMARVFGYVLTNSATKISARWRSEINASAVTVRQNSWGRYRVIP